MSFENEKRFTFIEIRQAFKHGISTGGLLVLCSLSLFQDFLGKERYIEVIQNHWVSPAITVPMAIVGLLITIPAIHFFMIKKWTE